MQASHGSIGTVALSWGVVSSPHLHHPKGPDPGQHVWVGTERRLLQRSFGAVRSMISGGRGDSCGSAKAYDSDDNNPTALTPYRFDGDIVIGVVVNTEAVIEYGCHM